MSQSAKPRPKTRSAAARLNSKKKDDNKRKILYGAIAVIVVLGIGYFIWEQFQTAQNGGISVPIAGSQHVPAGTALTFNHYPPSSGNHFDQAQPGGFYTQNVPEGNWIHSLEHGFVTILYKPTLSDDDKNRLRTYANTAQRSKYNTNKLIVVPYERMEAPITVVAWGFELPLQSVDSDRISRFVRARMDKGPADVP